MREILKTPRALYTYGKRVRAYSLERIRKGLRDLESPGNYKRINRLMSEDHRQGKKTVVFYVPRLGTTQYVLPLVQALQATNAPLDYYLATDYHMKQELAPFNISTKRIFNAEISRRLKFTDMFITPEIHGRGPESAIKVNISHGQPTKGNTYDVSNLQHLDVLFLLGPLQRSLYEMFANQHPEETHHIKTMNIGYPKSDMLLNGRFSREEVLSKLGLQVNRPTILYAPAWDPGTSLRSSGEEIIEALVGIQNINVLVKLHPTSLEPPSSPYFEWYTGGINWHQRLRRFECYANFRDIRDFFIDPFLAASDVLVTDISGTALEFMMLNRPVIYINCPEFFEKTLKMPGWDADPEFVRNDPRANAGRNAGLVVEDLTQLIEAIRRNLSHPGEFSDKRKTLASQLLYNPGKGALAAAEGVLSLLGLQKGSIA